MRYWGRRGTELLSPTSEPVHSRWESTDPRVTFSDPTFVTTDALVQGVGTFAVTYTTTVGVYEASDRGVITVVDRDAPRIDVIASTPASLWPPNHRMVEVAIHAEVSDGCDPAPQIRLVSVSSNEPEMQRGRGSGSTADDIQGAELGTADFSILLRAERDGRGRGRTYTVTYEAEDWAGNTSRASLLVQVSHDQRRRR